MLIGYRPRFHDSYNQVTVEVDEGALGERELAGALGDRRLDGFESGSTGAWSTVVP